MRHFAAATFVALLATPAAAQTPPEIAALPLPARAPFVEAQQMCRELDGKLDVATGATPYIRRADFNGDGTTDYLLSDEGLGCSTAASIYCGSAGCNNQVFLSVGTGYRKAWDGYAQELTIDQAAKPARLKLAMHGSACGRTGADTCYRTLAWNGRTFAPVTAAPRKRR